MNAKLMLKWEERLSETEILFFQLSAFTDSLTQIKIMRTGKLN